MFPALAEVSPFSSPRSAKAQAVAGKLLRLRLRVKRLIRHREMLDTPIGGELITKNVAIAADGRQGKVAKNCIQLKVVMEARLQAAIDARAAE